MVATVNPEFEHVFEGISTCRFALRIASVRNALLVNEETDPKLVIKRLREENRALRAELKLARGDVDGRDALSESEINRLRSDIERFCDDENDEPDLGGSMLKIRAALRVFRDLARTSRAGENARAATAVLAEGETNAAKENASEIERLASLVRRRDEEIKVLVAMLEKQSGLSSVANGAARAVARAEKEGGKQTEEHACSAFGPGPAKPSTPPSSMRSSPLRAKNQNHFFTDRNAAFEHFNLVPVGIGDEEKAGDHLACRCKGHEFAGVEAFRLEPGMLGLQIADRDSKVAVAVAKIVRLCLTLVHGQFEFELGFGIAQIDQREIREIEPVRHLKAEGCIIEFYGPVLIEHADHRMDLLGQG